MRASCEAGGRMPTLIGCAYLRPTGVCCASATVVHSCRNKRSGVKDHEATASYRQRRAGPMYSDRRSDDNIEMVRLPKLAPRVGIVVTALLLAVGAAIAVGEALGWPFLAGPMQRWLGSTLHRTVVF